jgi:hypothetical protein
VLAVDILKYTGRLPVASVAPYRFKFDISNTNLNLHGVFNLATDNPPATTSNQPYLNTMAPTTQTNKPAQNQTPAATKQEASCASRSSTNTNQRRPGRARGAEAYKGPNCNSLVEAVKHFLPLGSNEWANVQEHYNSEYALKNGRATCNQDSLWKKFRVLVNSSKPTGKANCPGWVHEAKQTQKLIDNCAKLLALDEESSVKE